LAKKIHLARAIDLFIDGARRTDIEAGGDEACVHAVGPSFDAGDDAFNAIPARGAVVEFLEAPELVGTTCGGEARRRALLQRVDMAAQRGRRSDTERIIDAVGAAEAQHFRRTIMAVAAQQDLDPRPMAANARDHAAQQRHDLAPVRTSRRAQHGPHQATVAIEHHDRLEAIIIVIGVEQPQLLAAMGGIERIVDVKNDPARHVAEAVAVEIDHGIAHAQQSALVRQVLQSRDRRLRTQCTVFRQASHGQLEHRIMPQRISIIAVFVARGDHQHAEADDFVDLVGDLFRYTRVGDAARHASGDAKPLFDLPQSQKTAVGGQQAAVKTSDDRLASNRRQIRQRPGRCNFSGHGVSAFDGNRFDANSYIGSIGCTRPFRCAA
jgi:hypothetical protein